MRSTIKLYSLNAALLLLPLMDFSLSAIPTYLKGLEFRALMAEVLTQVISGVLDAGIIAAIQATFGVTGA